MVAQNIAFGIVAAAMVVAAVGVVTSKNIVHAALYLVIVLGGVAAQYVILAAEFVAWTQVLIYLGAIIVLFLFGIFLTRAPMQSHPDYDNDQRLPSAATAIAVLALLVGLLVDAFGRQKITLRAPTTAAVIGDAIFRDFVIPFEIVSMLLLAALVGAIVLARRD
jgi:NADH-quinone oxidoreductase subunit J